jgi:hypothetical protein
MSRSVVRWLVLANLFALIVFIGLAGMSLVTARSADTGGGSGGGAGAIGAIQQKFAQLLGPGDSSGGPTVRDVLNAPGMARKAGCRANLRMIHMAKMTLAVEYGKAEGTPVSPQDIDRYLPEGFARLRCPAGGTYSINPVGANPTCSIPDHTLDAP